MRYIKTVFCPYIIFSVIVWLSLTGTRQVSGQPSLGLPFSNYYSSTDYNGGMQNWAITQNNEGVLYVANNFGLLEFDGTMWRLYRLPSSTKIRDVRVSMNGHIYVAGQGDFGFFSPDDQGRMIYTSLADSLRAEDRNFDEAWRIFQTNSEIIFCTFQNLHLFSNAGNFLKTIDPVYVPASFTNTNNVLYVSLSDQGLARLSDESLMTIPNGEFFTDMIVTGVLPLAQDRLWVATKSKGIFISTPAGEFNRMNIEALDKDNTGSINTAIRLSNGHIAIGTQYGGVYIISENGSLLQHLSKGNGLNNRTVLSLFEDNNRNLWIGHTNGISQLELSLPFTLLNEQTGLPGAGYDAHYQDGRLYLGTNNGLYVQDFELNTESDIELVDGTEDQVYFINNVQGKLMLGHQNGTYEVTGVSAEQISNIPGAWTFLALKDRPGYILGGNYDGLTLFRTQGNSLEYQHRIKGFSESSRVMQQDEQGNIWMTHGYKGVYRLTMTDDLDSVVVKHYTTANGLPTNLLINVWDIANRLIFSTVSGIYRYEQETDRFVPDPFFESYIDPGTTIISLAEDPLGNIYYNALNEMGVLQKQRNGGYTKETKVFGRIHQLLNDDLQKISILQANQVLYSAKEGFVMYTNESNSPIVQQPYETLIREVRVLLPSDSLISGGSYTSDNGVKFHQPENQIPVLLPENNSIHFKFSAPYLSTQGRTRYQFMLENFEKDYSEWTDRTEKEYTNLAPGKYTFRVRAINVYDQMSEENAYSFVISPPWYQTNVAYLSFAAGAIGFLLLLLFIVDKRYEKQKLKLTIKQKRELNQKDTALKSHQEEIDKLRNEKLLAEINNKNKELASSTMLLIHKNSFMNTVKQNLAHLMKNKSTEIPKEIERIMTTIDKNIEQDSGWEQFQIHFDEVHGDFASRFQKDFDTLSPQELKLSAYLRMNLSTKEIAHLMNISVRGVEVARYRLRKKLQLDRTANLQEFILKY